MSVYARLFQISWQQGFAYRASILFWRVRQFIGALMSLAVWSTIYTSKDIVAGYNQQEMLSYIFLTTLLQNIILTTSLNSLANQIYSGDLSNLLLKPISLIKYFISMDLADKLKNIFFTTVEIDILYAIFQPILLLPHLSTLALFCVGVFGGLVLLFLMQLLFGALGFWTPETWGPRFLFFMLIDISSGRLYPLDIFPKTVQSLFYLTPFPYFTFAQTQIYLGRLSFLEALQALGMVIIWILVLGGLVRTAWSKGLADYQAAGR